MEKLYMKRTEAIICMLAIIGMMMTGCKKEEGVKVTLGAEIADGISDGKVYLNNGFPVWEDTDHVWVNESIKSLTSVNGTKATVVDVTSADDYVAVFPAYAGVSADGQNVTVDIPRAQTFVKVGDNQKIVAPMVAYTTGRTLLFRNVCSLVKVHVENNSGFPLTVNRIAVNSSTRITGAATTTVGVNSATSPNVSTNGHFDAVLQFNTVNESIPNNGERDYYVIVAPLSSANVTVSLYMLYQDNNNVKHDMHRGVKYTGVSLAQSKVAPVNLVIPEINPNNPGDSDNPYIDGHYTINDAGKQVRFSRGNLQYRKGMSQGESYEDWRVAINQYDFVGGNGSSTSPYGNVTTASGATECHNTIDSITYQSRNYVYTQGKWIDLFGWGTGDNAVKYRTADGDYSSFTDWGTNSIDYYNHRTGRLTPTNITWRTLTQAEWDYLFNTRTTSTVNNVENSRYAMVRVTGISSVYSGSATSVYGILLFPDVFTWPSSISTLPGSINNANASFDSYTVDQFKELQKEGAVFLPFAGYRNKLSINDPNLVGTLKQPFNYWSSTTSSHTNSDHPEYSYAKAVRFYYLTSTSSYTLNTDASSRRSRGASVRLVQEVQ